MSTELGGKRIGLLKNVIPKVSRVAVILRLGRTAMNSNSSNMAAIQQSFSASASAPQDNFPARQPESLKTQHCVGGVSLIKACCYQFLCCNFVALAFSWP
jgi:hypothetical protein